MIETMNPLVSTFLKVTLSTLLELCLFQPSFLERISFDAGFGFTPTPCTTGRAAYGKTGIVFLTLGLLSLWATLDAIWRSKPLLIV